MTLASHMVWPDSGLLWSVLPLQASTTVGVLFFLLFCAVVGYLLRVLDPLYEGGYDADTAPAVGATARVVERATPVAGKAIFHSGFGDRRMPVRTDGGSIEIGEQVVVVDHGVDGMPLVEAGVAPMVDAESTEPAQDTSAGVVPTGAVSDSAEVSTPPETGRTSSYELTTRDGGRYRFEVAPVIDEDMTPAAHRDGTLLEALGETIEAVDETEWEPHALDAGQAQQWVAGEQLLWIEHVEQLEAPTTPDESQRDGEDDGVVAGTDEGQQDDKETVESPEQVAETDADSDPATERE